MLSTKAACFILIVVHKTLCNPMGKILYNDLMLHYNKLVRPIRNHSLAIDIHFKMKLTQILDVVEKRQTLILNGFLIHLWHDYRLQWNPDHYEGVRMLHIPSQFLWLPDIILYNNADGSPQVTQKTKAHIYYTGIVFWEPPVIYQSMCPMDIAYFPFDEQKCSLKFGSWTYTSEEVRILPLETALPMDGFEHEKPEKQANSSEQEKMEAAMDLSEYQESSEWDLMAVVGLRHHIIYPCCTPLAYIDITYYLEIRRKTLFYTLNFITPCVLLTTLCTLVFYLPVQSRNKINLCVSVLVSLNVFLLLLIEIIPPISVVVPLLGQYLLLMMFLVTFSLVFSVVVTNMSNQTTAPVSPPPTWARRLFIHWLPHATLLRKSSQTLLSDQAQKKSSAEPLQQKLLLEQLESAQKNLPISLLYPKVKPLLEAVGKANWGLQYIREHFRLQRQEQLLRDEWLFMAMVMDRVLLIVFMVTSIIAGSIIILSAPTLWDSRIPINQNKTV